MRSGVGLALKSAYPWRHAGEDVMLVKAIDHINILTDDLDGTVSFYEQALGLTRGESPATKMGYRGAWLFDAAGHPLVHLGLKDPERDYGPEHVPGSVTGSLHHVAFACEDFADAKARLDDMGVEYRTTEVADFDFRQIMLKDPNNINLELNFAGR
jgi:catechol 2,3-dioxygenase-like lactoylglutathione lyase family enzyme